MLGNQLIIAVHIRKKQHRLSGIQIQVKEIPVQSLHQFLINIIWNIIKKCLI